MHGARANRGRVLVSLSLPLLTVIFVGATVHAAVADTLYVSENNSNTLGKVDQNLVHTTLATGFSNPQGVAVDAAGNVYVSDGGSLQIKKVTPLGVVTTFASLNSSPVGLTFDKSGNLYAAMGNAGAAYKITPGGVVTTYATGLNSPYGLAFDSQGYLYSTNLADNTVRRAPPGGGASSIWLNTNLNAPQGIAADAADNLYVANTIDGTITKITSAGTPSLFASTGSVIYGAAMASNGNLLVGDIFSTIYQVTPGGVVSPYVSGLNGPRFFAVYTPEPGTAMAVGLIGFSCAASRRRGRTAR
jgi:NHL repeat